MLKRVPTGIPGFDELCSGGFLKDRCYLVSGPAGSGKTVFAMQFIINGIVDYNEPGIFITTEERPRHLRENFSSFGWDLEKYESENLLAIVDATSTKINLPSEEKYVTIRPFDTRALLDQVLSTQDEINARRAAFDSITSIGYFLNDPGKFRFELLKISTVLELIGLTSILTCESPGEGESISRFGVENFVVDGIIILYYKKVKNMRIRALEICKMKGSTHSRKIHLFEITDRGIVVYPKEEAVL